MTLSLPCASLPFSNLQPPGQGGGQGPRRRADLPRSHPPSLAGTHVLQLEVPRGPLALGLLGQEVDGDVTVGDRGGVSWPVVLTKHLGPEGQSGVGGQVWAPPITATPAVSAPPTHPSVSTTPLVRKPLSPCQAPAPPPPDLCVTPGASRQLPGSCANSVALLRTTWPGLTAPAGGAQRCCPRAPQGAGHRRV